VADIHSFSFSQNKDPGKPSLQPIEVSTELASLLRSFDEVMGALLRSFDEVSTKLWSLSRSFDEVRDPPYEVSTKLGLPKDKIGLG
jgi:hypothetical protein